MIGNTMKATKRNIVTALQELVAINSDALDFLELLASKEKSTRGGRTTAVYLVRQFRDDVGREVTRQQAVELLKALADCGAGDYVVGRSGQETRLEWKFKTTSIGRAALDGPGGLESLSATKLSRRKRNRLRADPSTSFADAPSPDSREVLTQASKEPVRVTFSRGDRQWEVVGEPGDVASILRGLDTPTPDDGGPQPTSLRLQRTSA